jgi:phospholipid/cholesterol/gamma-HCH transport system permease protein
MAVETGNIRQPAREVMPTRLERASSLPGPDYALALARNMGGFATFGLEVARSMLGRRPIWGREFLIQCSFVTRSTMIPVMLVNGVFGLAIIGLSAGVPLSQLGTLDRDAALAGPGLIRDFGVFMTGAVFAGVLGTTIAAEFGARKIREELEALDVLGVDVMRSMIVPRIAAMMVMQVVAFFVGVAAGSFGAFMAMTVFFHEPTAEFLPQLLANVSYVDLWAAMIKVLIFGFVIGVIACFKGLNAKGGAEGVGRAVNESVVACLIAVFFVNIVYTQFLLALYPNVASFR